MRTARANRVDDNQAEIVNALEKVGASVKSLGAVGDGCPDLLVGHSSVNYLMEVKNPQQFPSHRKLTPEQEKWHRLWRGQKAIVETPEDALRVLGLL